jgi:hypothetical protein
MMFANRSTGPLLLLSLTATATAAAPDWLRAVVSAPAGTYSDKTSAVVLLDERTITVKDNGEIKTNRRLAVKVLRPEGKQYAVFGTAFDPDTRLAFLKAWSFPPGQPEYEIKEKEAVESSYTADALYSEVRRKVLTPPAAGPGTVAGYEYEQRGRPFLLQHIWDFQQRIPVRKARLILQLPPGWEFQSVWRNFPGKPPSQAGNQWTWELDNVAPVETEPLMPAWSAVAGHLALTYLSAGQAGKSHASWRDVAAWYSSLAAPRLTATPDLALKTAEVIASSPTQWKKIEVLAAFVQQQIRYVAIPIGIGSHQPHAASQILANRYGDCKDKATLLKAMLRQAGIDSFYVLVNSERGSVNPEFASVLNFDHVILAIRLPPDKEGVLYATFKHPVVGDLIAFDPTDALTPLGMLPAPEQAAHGLLVLDDGGDLIQLPQLPPGASRLIRSGALKLQPDGSLTGFVQETRWGGFASAAREAYRRAERLTQTRILETFLAQSLGSFEVTKGSIESLGGTGILTLNYTFVSPRYAKATGPMLLLRPRVLGLKATQFGERKDRQHPIQLESTSVESDLFEIELPEGYDVDELPAAVTADYPFASYGSKTEIKDRTLRYERHLTINQLEIPQSSFDAVWTFNRLISADELSYAVLRKK